MPLDITTLKVGDRIRATRDLGQYPLGRFPIGTSGTILDVDVGARRTNPVVIAQLDNNFECLNDWNNELQIYREADGVSDIVETAFELIPVGFV